MLTDRVRLDIITDCDRVLSDALLDIILGTLPNSRIQTQDRPALEQNISIRWPLQKVENHPPRPGSWVDLKMKPVRHASAQGIHSDRCSNPGLSYGKAMSNRRVRQKPAKDQRGDVFFAREMPLSSQHQ